MHPSTTTTITPMIIALVAATLAGCTSSPGGASSALPTPTATTGPVAMATAATPTAEQQRLKP